MREQLLLFERAKSHDQSINYSLVENENMRLTNNRLVVIPSQSGPFNNSTKSHQGHVNDFCKDDQKDNNNEEDNDDDVEYIDFEK